MAPSTLKEPISPGSIADAGSDVETTTNTEETITEEPTPMEDIKSTSSQDISSNNNKQPETSPIKELKDNKSLRQDSGFAEVDPKKLTKKATQLSDNAPLLD